MSQRSRPSASLVLAAAAPELPRPPSPPRARRSRAGVTFELVETARAATLTAAPEEVAAVARVLAGGEAAATHVAAATRVIVGLGGLRGLARAGRTRIVERGALGDREADALVAALALERALHASRAASVTAPRLASADAVGRWAVPRLGALEHEEVWVLVFGVRQQMLSARRVFQGGVQTVTFHLPSLLREVIAEGGARFVLVHNHPSGDPSPSPEDIVVTERVARAGAVLGVPLVDHVVVGARSWQCVPFRA